MDTFAVTYPTVTVLPARLSHTAGQVTPLPLTDLFRLNEHGCALMLDVVQFNKAPV